MSEILNTWHSTPGNGLGLGHLKAASGVAPAETSSLPVGDSEEAVAITGASAGVGSGEVVIDDVEVSEEAESFLGALTGPGKSHQSTAHRAFAALEENPSLAGLPFGKIVSTLARTGNLASLLPPPVETGETGETGSTGEAPAGGAIPDPISTDALPTDGPVAGSAALSLLEAIADPDSGEDDDEFVELLKAVASPDDFDEVDENNENDVNVAL